MREVKEELRNMRLEAHTKQLSKELRSARAALEQERKLRKVQSDTIKVRKRGKEEGMEKGWRGEFMIKSMN